MADTAPSGSAALRDHALLWGAGLLSIAATLLPKLALIAAFLTWILFISRQRLRLHWPRAAPVMIAIAALASLVALGRFTLSEAIPGILRGGNLAVDRNALSKVRQIVTAQDALRRRALMDHDGDKVGSAGRIAELSGLVLLRGGESLNPPALNYDATQLVDTAIGPAIRIGAHLLVVCVPTSDGKFSAQATGSIDEERAERSYYVYTWPLATGLGVQRVYAADQHERIWFSENLDNGTLRFAGPSFPPPCESVRDPAAQFQPWMDKKPREHLPGDAP